MLIAKVGAAVTTPGGAVNSSMVFSSEWTKCVRWNVDVSIVGKMFVFKVRLKCRSAVAIIAPTAHQHHAGLPTQGLG